MVADTSIAGRDLKRLESFTRADTISAPRWPSVFFCTGRRRHTRCSRDWSSDVCSSDLHLDRHGPYLWGHALRLPRRVGGGIRLVARTNNGLESLFHTIKHGERRRSGRKILTQDFEILPPAAALATNLHHADYVSLLCGSLDRLPEAFAALDAPQDRKSTRLNSSHGYISYAVFCLKKKKP